MKTTLKHTTYMLSIVLGCLLMVWQSSSTLARGLSEQDIDSIHRESTYYEDCEIEGGNNDTGSSGDSATSGIEFTTGMTVNTDGVGPSHGNPYHQSQTSYANGKLNADNTNYLALAQGYAKKNNLTLGDVAAVQYQGKTSYAIYADNWQDVDEIHGEGSYRLVKELGMDFNGTSGGADSGVKYIIYPGSHTEWNGSIDDSINQAKIDEIGQRLFGTPSTNSGRDTAAGDCACAPNAPAGAESIQLRGGDNPEKIYNFMIDKGLSDVQAAGALGNIMQESKGDPQLVEEGGRSKTPTSGGWGIIQWTPGTKVIDIAASQGVTGPIHELETQLLILWNHMTGTSATGAQNMLEEYKKITGVREATAFFEDKIEGAGIPMMENRYAFAEAALQQFGTGTDAAISTSAGIDCSCPDPTAGTTTVVLDPGHSGSAVLETDPDTGIKTSDGNNGQETKDMWAVSEKIRKTLEEKGYKVISTKNSEQDSVGLLKRAKIANDANAAIAVSLHSTPGTFGSESVGWVTPQEVGLYRETGSNKKTFDNEEVANKSKEYANKILSERKKVEGGAQIHRLDFPASRGLGATGNISIVQLFSKIPWVYNEVGQSGFNADKYAEGITKGIETALSVGGTDSDTGGQCAGGGDGLAATIKRYAWPDYHQAPYITPKEAYRRAVQAAKSKGRYVGGTVRGEPGIDCGGFVTLAMIDSGYEPGYNFAGIVADGASNTTIGQEPWLRENWKQIHPQSTGDMQPGDVAINETHTYMYVGQISGFNSDTASASYTERSDGGRAPMAGGETAADPSYRWYRKK